MPISNPGLLFGAVNLVGTDAELAANGYRFEAEGDDTSWGNPVPITEKILSWLQDGSIVALKGYDNREMNVRVRVVGDDLGKLAVGEAVLMLETGKPNLLTWTPPDGIAAPCVFSVVTSSLEFSFDDLDEGQVSRSWALKITAEPFVRSATLTSVSIPAPPTTPTTTLVDACTSTTGWAATRTQFVGGAAVASVGLSTSGGAVRGLTSAASLPLSLANPNVVTLTRTGLSAAVTSTKFVRVQATVALNNGVNDGFIFKLNGVEVPVASQSGDLYWLDASTAPGGAITTLTSVAVSAKVRSSTNPKTPSASTAELIVWDISRTDVASDTTSTNRELFRTLPVAGSARTQAFLSLSDASAALGTVLLYTRPSANAQAQPPLRRYLTSSPTVTADTSLVSGSRSDLVVKHTFDIPADQVDPGAHVLMARVRAVTVASYAITWAGKSRMGSTDLDSQDGVTNVGLGGNVWFVHQIATLHLPPTRLGADGFVRIELTGPAGVALDEAWIFNVETGQLTWVECDDGSPTSGGSSNRAWFDPPFLGDPNASVWIGVDADRSDSRDAGIRCKSRGVHEITPPSVNVMTVTTNSVASSLNMSHYAAGHTHTVL